MKRPILILISMLVVASLACSISLNLPTAKTGDTETLVVNESYPAARPAELVIEMGGGKLNLTGGSSQLIEGVIDYNVAEWEPEITRDGQEIRLEQKVSGAIPIGDGIINEWDLQLGNEPIDLSVKAGAYEGEIDLTGVPVVRLKVSDGASQSRLIFDAPNPVQMDSLTYGTGASNVELEGLAYSDADVINFSGGAGNFSLDFSGTLKRDMRVYIDGGLGNITVKIPRNTNSRITLSSSLNTISTEGSWIVNDNEYRTNGEGPLLRIDIKVGVGNLNLIND